MEAYLPTLIGTAAGICSTASFVPQVWKCWRFGETDAISLRMYLVTVTAFSLWIVYGLFIASLPIVVFNALSLGLSSSVLVMKLRNVRRARDADPQAGTIEPEMRG